MILLHFLSKIKEMVVSGATSGILYNLLPIIIIPVGPYHGGLCPPLSIGWMIGDRDQVETPRNQSGPLIDRCHPAHFSTLGGNDGLFVA